MNSVIGALRVSLGLDSASFEGGLTGAQRTMKRFERDMAKLSANLQGIGGALTLGVTTPLVAVGGAMAKLSIDAEEMNSAFAVSFGKMAKETEAWAVTTGDALGRSTQEMQKGALAFNGLFKAGGPATAEAAAMSKQFAILAQDLSSFYNVSPDVALQSLISGLSGEAEPLRKFNVFLTESAVRLKAVELGLGTMKGELSESAKIQARAALITKATAEAQGDVERTASSTANQLRKLQSEWQELSVTLGSTLIPLLKPIVTGLADMVKGFGTLSPTMQKIILIGAGVAAAIGPILIGAGALVSSIAALTPILIGAGTAATGFGVAIAAALGPVGIGLAVVAAALTALYIATSQAAVAQKEFKDAANKSATAAGAYEKAVQAATTATGKDRDAALKNAAAKREEAMQTLQAAKAKLADANASLVAARAKMASNRAAAADPMNADYKTGTALNQVGGDLRRRTDQAAANVAEIAGSVKDAQAAISSADRIIQAATNAPQLGGGGGGGGGGTGDGVRAVGRAAAAAAKPVDELNESVKALLESLLTPGEQAAKQRATESEILQKAYDAELITTEELLDARQRMRDQDFRSAFPGTVKAAPDQNPQLVDMNLPTATFGGAIMSEEAAKALREQMAGTFRGALDSLKSGGTKGLFQWMADQLSDRLMDRLADILTNLMDQILSAMVSSGGGSGIFSTIGAALTSMFGGGGSTPGFATGGSFTVGGSGGIDSQLMQFRATPGEMVNIRKPGQDAGGGMVVHVNPSPYFDVQVERVAAPMAVQAAATAYGATRSDMATAQRRSRQRFV